MKMFGALRKGCLDLLLTLQIIAENENSTSLLFEHDRERVSEGGIFVVRREITDARGHFRQMWLPWDPEERREDRPEESMCHLRAHHVTLSPRSKA